MNPGVAADASVDELMPFSSVLLARGRFGTGDTRPGAGVPAGAGQAGTIQTPTSCNNL
jgi:hypothetical protein